MRKKLVMVSGGFDPLHPGHLRYFEAARGYGEKLLVAIDSDEYVARKHPVMLPAAQRAGIVFSLRQVDEVVVSSGPDVSQLLRENLPDVYCVGPDHENVTKIPEYPVCKELGVEVICLKHLLKMSSTDLISKVQYGNMPITVSLLSSGHRDGPVIVRDRHGWALPGGFVEAGETLEDALRREVYEELNAVPSFPDYAWSMVGTYHDGRQVLSCYFMGGLNYYEVGNEVLEAKRTTVPIELSTDCDTWALRKFLS